MYGDWGDTGIGVNRCEEYPSAEYSAPITNLPSFKKFDNFNSKNIVKAREEDVDMDWEIND